MMPYSLSITSFIFPPAIIRSTCSQSLIGIFLLHCTLCKVQIAHSNTDQGHHMGYTMQWQDHSALADHHLQGCHGIPTATEYRLLQSTSYYPVVRLPALYGMCSVAGIGSLDWYIHSWKVSVLDQSPGPEIQPKDLIRCGACFFELSSAGAVKRLGLLEGASEDSRATISFLKKVRWLSRHAPTCRMHRTFDCDRVWPGIKRRIDLPLSELIGQSRQESIVFVWLWLLWGVVA